MTFPGLPFPFVLRLEDRKQYNKQLKPNDYENF